MPVDLSDQLRLSYLRAVNNAIEEEEDKIQSYRDFYNGDQDIELTDRQKEYLRDTDMFDSFGNICKRVVAIPGDRLAITEEGILPANAESQRYADEARKWWSDVSDPDMDNDNDAFSIQSDVYEAALRDGSTAIIVGWDDARNIPTFTPNLIYDGATGLIRFHYDDNNKLVFASKRWIVQNPISTGVTGTPRLTVYRPDLIERYEADPNTAGGYKLIEPTEDLPNPQFWTTDGTASGEPLGIPVIPFDDPNGSELSDVIIIQEFLNHNLATFDISIDYHSFPLIWFAGFDFPVGTDGRQQIPILQPGTGFAAVGEDATANRIEPADLKMMFESGVMSWVQVLALVKGWPVWLFDRSQQAPSGVALQTMETSLVKQVKRKQRSFSGSWRKAFNLARKLYQLKVGTELPGQITFDWMAPETNDEVSKAEVMEKTFNALSLPTITRWRRSGMTEADIQQALADASMEDDLGLIEPQSVIR